MRYQDLSDPAKFALLVGSAPYLSSEGRADALALIRLWQPDPAKFEAHLFAGVRALYDDGLLPYGGSARDWEGGQAQNFAQRVLRDCRYQLDLPA